MTATLRVVLADDDVVELANLKEMIESLHHRVVATAMTGREAVEHCRLCEPDLVITDATMPGMNGVEACQIIRGQMEVPVIVLENADDIVVRDTEAPCCRRLPKPVRKRELAQAIEDVLADSARVPCGEDDGNVSHWFG